MKKILTLLALISLLALPAISLAVEPGSIPKPGETFESELDLLNRIEEIGDWIFTGLLVIAAIFMVLSGFYFVTGGSEPEKVNKARDMLRNALIGVGVGLASRGLIAVIENLIRA